MLIEITRPRCVKQLRAEPRMKVLLTAALRTRTGMIGCRVVDISRGGACIETDREQMVGADIALDRGALQVPGKVVWSRGRRCGMQFERPIRATDLFVQMSESRRREAGPVSVAAIPLSPST